VERIPQVVFQKLGQHCMFAFPSVQEDHKRHSYMVDGSGFAPDQLASIAYGMMVRTLHFPFSIPMISTHGTVDKCEDVSRCAG
jgi:hypothetical protein